MRNEWIRKLKTKKDKTKELVWKRVGGGGGGRHRRLWWKSPHCVTGQRTNGREHLHESEGSFGKIQLPFLNFEVWLFLTFWNNFECMESCWKVQKTLSSFTHLSVFCHIDSKWDNGDAGHAPFCHIVLPLTYRFTFRETGGSSSPFSLQGPWFLSASRRAGWPRGSPPWFLLSCLLEPINPHYFVNLLVPLSTLF